MVIYDILYHHIISSIVSFVNVNLIIFVKMIKLFFGMNIKLLLL